MTKNTTYSRRKLLTITATSLTAIAVTRTTLATHNNKQHNTETNTTTPETTAKGTANITVSSNDPKTLTRNQTQE